MTAPNETLTTSQILRNAKILVEKGWCQTTMARDSMGNGVGLMSTLACKFCLGGAIRRASNDSSSLYQPARSVVARVIQAVTNDKDRDNVNLSTWNDTKGRTQADVLEVLSLSIEMAERIEARLSQYKVAPQQNLS